LSRDHPLYKYIDFNVHIMNFTSNNVYKWQYFTLITNEVRFNYNLSGDGDPRWGFIPTGNGDGEEMSPASVRGDPTGNFLSRGRVWGAKTRRGIPRCHPYAWHVRLTWSLANGLLCRNYRRPDILRSLPFSSRSQPLVCSTATQLDTPSMIRVF
jgi:hypothetical protein